MHLRIGVRAALVLIAETWSIRSSVSIHTGAAASQPFQEGASYKRSLCDRPVSRLDKHHLGV